MFKSATLLNFVAAIRGADTLKARSGYKNRLNGSSPVLPLEDNNELDFNFEKCRLILAKGAEINIETADGTKYHNRLTVIAKFKIQVL